MLNKQMVNIAHVKQPNGQCCPC